MTTPQISESARKAEGWVLVHPDGRLEIDYFGVNDFRWKKDGYKAVISPEVWRQTYRPECTLVRMTLMSDADLNRERKIAIDEATKGRSDSILNSSNTAYLLSFLKNSGENMRAIRLVMDISGCTAPEAREIVERKWRKLS